MKLNELEQIIEILNSNKTSYENSKKNIEHDINNLKKEITDYVEKVKKVQSVMIKNSINVLGINNDENAPKFDSLFLKGSMLLNIDDFGKKDVFSSTNIFFRRRFCEKRCSGFTKKKLE